MPHNVRKTDPKLATIAVMWLPANGIAAHQSRYDSAGGYLMRKRLMPVCWVLLVPMLFMAASGQSLNVGTESIPGGSNIVSVNFNAEGAGVVALQFDLQFNTQKIKMSGLQVARGKMLTSEHGFEYRQIQADTLRVVIYPPIAQQMPSLTSGQAMSIKFPELDAAALEHGDIRFVPESVVLSDAAAKAVKAREITSSLGRNKGRRK
jgi:hypothetical protein